jgi:MFS family permease
MAIIGVTMMVQELYRSYQLAGMVAAVMTVATALAAPVVGRLLDRRGQRKVGHCLIALFFLSSGGLAVACLQHAATVWLCILAVVVGATLFPTSALVRSRWVYLLADPALITTAFSFESVFDDIAYMCGPALATLVATTVNPTAGLALAVLTLLVGGLGLLAQRDSQPPVHPRPENQDHAKLAIRLPGVWAVCLVFLGVGVVFGANGIAMVAVCESLGVKWAAGLLLGLGSAASMIGALVYGARQWRSPLHRRFQICLVLLAVTSGLFLLAKSVPLLAIVSVLAGVAISPSFINGNALIQRLTPPHQLTEGMTWIGTMLNCGTAVGSALAGRLIEQFRPSAGYWALAGGALLALLIAVVSVGTLSQHSQEPHRKAGS